MSAANYCIGVSDIFNADTKKILIDRIPDLNAEKITAGTINNARLPTDISVNSFTGSGANITAINAAKITTGTIDNDRIALTTNKLYENFNTTNFAVIDDKIDLPPTYSFNITSYDSPTLYVPSEQRRLKGKFSAQYDDRQGLYSLVSTDNTKTTNKLILNYKNGDGINIRNIGDPKKDYFANGSIKEFLRILLVKRPVANPLVFLNPDIYSTSIFM
jgi:hypothetical protein